MTATQRIAIEHALRELGHVGRVRDLRNLSGGCIHTVVQADLDDGSSCVVKIGGPATRPIFDEEAAGLQALAATETVLVPAPLLVTEASGIALLVLETIEPGRATERGWEQFGLELARMHRVPRPRRYGSDIDNHLGATPQPNAWSDDWVEFNRDHRLGHQLRLGRRTGVIRDAEATDLDRLLNRLDHYLPRTPPPALLHGDLWSGNALPSIGDRVALIDPAVSIGDGWADIAMMQLFGGFPACCYAAYRSAIDDVESIEVRILVYQLYHVMNHVNLFGRGYATQMMSIVDRLGGKKTK